MKLKNIISQNEVEKRRSSSFNESKVNTFQNEQLSLELREAQRTIKVSSFPWKTSEIISDLLLKVFDFLFSEGFRAPTRRWP